MYMFIRFYVHVILCQIIKILGETSCHKIVVFFFQVENFSDEQIADFKEAFTLFDKAGEGSISAMDLGTLMRTIGQNPTLEDVEEMISEVDRGGNCASQRH